MVDICLIAFLVSQGPNLDLMFVYTCRKAGDVTFELIVGSCFCCSFCVNHFCQAVSVSSTNIWMMTIGYMQRLSPSTLTETPWHSEKYCHVSYCRLDHVFLFPVSFRYSPLLSIQKPNSCPCVFPAVDYLPSSNVLLLCLHLPCVFSLCVPCASLSLSLESSVLIRAETITRVTWIIRLQKMVEAKSLPQGFISDKVQCVYCKQELVRHNSRSTMIQHLNRKHVLLTPAHQASPTQA